MGLLDDLLKNTSQGNDLPKSLMDAVNSILAGPNQQQPGAQGAAPRPAGPGGQGAQDNGFLSGIIEIVEKLQKGGHAETVKSWVGKGENAPIGPEPLKKALGSGTVKDLANQSGLSEQELLQQLAKTLPGLIDRITPNGRLPRSLQELVANLQR